MGAEEDGYKLLEEIFFFLGTGNRVIGYQFKSTGVLQLSCGFINLILLEDVGPFMTEFANNLNLLCSESV
jgi:hypothetical protein